MEYFERAPAIAREIGYKLREEMRPGNPAMPSQTSGERGA